MVLKRTVDEPDIVADVPITRSGGGTVTSGGRVRIGTQTVAPGNVLSSRTTAGRVGPGGRPLYGDRRDNPPNPFDIAGDFSSATLQAILRTMRSPIQQIPRTGGLPVAVAKPTPPPPVPSPSASESGHAEGVKQIKAPTTTRVKTMDLGDILGTAVGIYKDFQVAKSVPQYVDAKYGAPAVQTPALNIPFVDVIPESDQSTKGMVWNPRANCGQGGWVKSRRRRRRRLATVSDIKDLAALKSVLGQGKAFETWIATHS